LFSENKAELKKENNILMIAYLFPPLGGSGALRPLKLAKYLPMFGWNPIILTVKNQDYYYANDPELLNELSPNTIIKRCFMLKSAWIYRILNPFRIRKIDKIIRKYVFHPDEKVGWIPFAYRSAVNIARKHNVSAVYSTSGPLSCHLIAFLLKRKVDIPWIAEFRDEWFEDPGLNFPTPFHRNLHYKLEKKIVDNADKIITMAPVFGKLLSKHGDNLNKFYTITAGYDSEDFIEKNFQDSEINNKKKFTTAFIGLFYNTFRPVTFLKAIGELIEEGKVSREDITVRFVGANVLNDIGIEDYYNICEFTGFIPRIKALKYLFQADVLLLLLSKARGKDVIPSKIFEYMASGKPILSLVPPDGDAASIIKKTNTGVVADFDNVEDIKIAYLEFYNQWKRNDISIKTDWKEVKKFEQKKLAKNMVDIINEKVFQNI
jgi:glycosyltransferase involved in cell wall biosynthesis